VTTNSAILNGNLTSLGTAPSVLVSFEWSLTTSYGNETSTQILTSSGAFGAPLSGLTPATAYHFRAKAVGDGTSYGDDMTFVTATVPPAATTNAATNIGLNSATLNGNLTSLGTAPSVQVSLEWGLTTSYGNESTPQTMMSTGPYTANLIGLSPGTLYHFRAKAVGDDTTYGVDMTFTTKAPPTVATNAATGIGTNSVTVNGNLTSLGTASSVQVSFQWGLSTSYTYETPASTMYAPSPFAAYLVGLTPGTTYHYRAKAVGDDTTYGADMTFTTPTPLSVTTKAASNATSTSATLNGNLDSMGGASSVTVSFQVGTTTAYGHEFGSQTMTAAGPFSYNITGLARGTTYHYRAKAVAGGNTVYGADMSFTTPTSALAVSTTAATNVATDSATLNGSLTSLGGASSAQVSFQWGLTTGYGNETAPPQTMTATGAFSAPLSGLTPGTTYHYRAKAVAGSTTAYGADMTFTPGVAALAVSTTAATNITATSATLNGNLTSLGGASSVTVSFQFGLTTGYGYVRGTQTLTAPGPFSFTMTGLTTGTTYHYRAKAVAGSTAYGADVTFVPAAGLAVTTSAATNVTATSATLNGSLSSLGGSSSAQVSFQWGLTTGYGNETAPPQTMTATGAFSAPLSGLTPGTTYHFRAKAVAGSTTAYGADMTFTTTNPGTAPQVRTDPATNITRTSATLNGYLVSLGTASSVTVSFQVGTTTSYGRVFGTQTLTATGPFSYNLTGLTPGATYHFRARAVGGGTTVYGADMMVTASP
jgi:hypothetical protein